MPASREHSKARHPPDQGSPRVAHRPVRRPARPSDWRQQLAAVVKFSDDAIFSVDHQGRINSWNPAAERIFGHRTEQALTMSFSALFPAGGPAEGEALLRRIQAGEHVSRYETTAVRRDQQQLTVALTISPMLGRGRDKITGASIIARDITEQKTAEEKLRTSEAFYHSLVENLPQFMFRKDLDHRITFANQRHCQTLGLPLQEIIGKTDFDFYPAELAAKYQADDQRVIDAGETFETVEVNQPPGGKKIYVHVCKTPIRDADGQIIGVQGIFWDITASREAEEALRLSEERYRKLVNSVTDYLYTVELRDGKPVATRHGPGCQAVTGYTPEDYENAAYLWYLMIHPDDREAVMRQIERLLSGHAEPLEHRIIHRDSTVRWVRNTQVPRLDDHGRVMAYDGLISDITARKLAEEKLRQANAELSASRDQLMRALDELHQSHEELKAAQMLLIRAEKMETVGRLAAGVAHEVKNPLAVILSGIDYLSSLPLAGDETLALVLRDMRDALHRADSVVRGLLDVAASQELGVQAENLNTVIERPLGLLRHVLVKAGVVVRKELAGDLPLADIDRSKIEQVFLNLFMNAVHAMPKGGELVVRTRPRVLAAHEIAADPGARGTSRWVAGARIVVVEIEDTGEGIPPEMMSRLFEPFMTSKPTGKGTGLGLAVSKKILEMHGANINIQNRPEGGVRVTITFCAD